MKKFLSVWLLCLLPMASWACEYGNDPRIESNVRGLIKSIQSGQDSSPIRMTLGTYLGMKPKTREAFGELITIVSKACNPVSVFDGEVMGMVSIPFEEYYRTIARAIRKDRPKMFKDLKAHATVASMPLEKYIDLFGMLAYPKTGGKKVRHRIKQLYPQAGKFNPQEDWLKDPSTYGRMDDYTMARLFKAWGGTLLLNKGCGPYTLSKKFYVTEKYKGLFNKSGTRTVAKQYPPRIMARVIGPYIEFDDATHYHIKGCTP